MPNSDNYRFGIGESVYIMQPIGRPEGTVERQHVGDGAEDCYTVRVGDQLYFLPEHTLVSADIRSKIKDPFGIKREMEASFA